MATCFTAISLASGTRVHQQNTPGGLVQAIRGIKPASRGRGASPATVLPFEYGVPELVKRQGFGGSFTGPGECQTSRNLYHPVCPLAPLLFREQR